MKCLYDAKLFVCPLCHDSWYAEEDYHYRIECKCGIRTPWFLSKEKAEKEWYKYLCRDSILRQLKNKSSLKQD